MTIRKVADITVRASPNGRSTVTGSGTTFYSYDKNSAALDFHIQEQDGSPTDIFNCEIKLLLLTQKNGMWEKFTLLDSELKVISSIHGHARYIIPDRLRGYHGIVEGYVYLNFRDDSRTDECRFTFRIERSKIEEEFENAGDFYIKEIQDVFDNVKSTLNGMVPKMQTEFDKLVKMLTDYANTKLTEYDKQFVTLNSSLLAAQTSITNLGNSITDLNTQAQAIQQKQADIQAQIDSGGLVTKDQVYLKEETMNSEEISANVIYQVIGKEEVEITLTLDLKDKVANSDEENPNKSMRIWDGETGVNKVLKPSEFKTSLDQQRYDAVGTLNNSYISVTYTPKDGVPQQLLGWNVIESLKRHLGVDFFIDRGATTLEAQVAVAKEIVTSAVPSIWGFGKGPTQNRINAVRFGNGTYGGPTYYDGTTISKVTLPDVDEFWKKYLIQNDGFIYVNAYSEASDGTTYSAISVDYANLVLKFRISANEHIKSMIAAYHRENGVDLKEDQTIDGIKTFVSRPLVGSKQVALKDETVDLTSPQQVSGDKNFTGALMVNNVAVATEASTKEYRVNGTAVVPSTLTSSISSIKYTLLRVGNRVKIWMTVNVTSATGLDAVPEIFSLPAGYKLDSTMVTTNSNINLVVGQLLVNTLVNNYAGILTSSSAIRFGTTRGGNHYLYGEWLTSDAIPQ